MGPIVDSLFDWFSGPIRGQSRNNTSKNTSCVEDRQERKMEINWKLVAEEDMPSSRPKIDLLRPPEAGTSQNHIPHYLECLGILPPCWITRSALRVMLCKGYVYIIFKYARCRCTLEAQHLHLCAVSVSVLEYRVSTVVLLSMSYLVGCSIWTTVSLSMQQQVKVRHRMVRTAFSWWIVLNKYYQKVDWYFSFISRLWQDSIIVQYWCGLRLRGYSSCSLCLILESYILYRKHFFYSQLQQSFDPEWYAGVERKEWYFAGPNV